MLFFPFFYCSPFFFFPLFLVIQFFSLYRVPSRSPLRPGPPCVRTLPLHCYWLLTDILTYSYVACSFDYLLDFWLMGASKNEPSHNFSLDLVMCCIGSVGLEGSPLPFHCLYWICCLFLWRKYICLLLLYYYYLGDLGDESEKNTKIAQIAQDPLNPQNPRATNDKEIYTV